MHRYDVASHRQLVRIAHDVLDNWPGGASSDLDQAVKDRVIALGMSWGRYNHRLYAAIESALFQRRANLRG